MSYHEFITISISLLAVIISAVSLMRTNKLAKVTHKLSVLQIQNIEQENSSKTKPNFNVTLSKLGKSWFFYVSNTGRGSAFNVDFELIDCERNPLTSDIHEKFPHPEMKPNSRVKLLAAIGIGSPSQYQVKLSWLNSAQQPCEEIFWVTL